MPNNSHVLRQTDHLEVRLGLRSRPHFGFISPPHLFESSLCIAFRRLAKLASTCALDCLQVRRGKESAKPFRKPQSLLMSFPVGTPTSRRLRGLENEVLEGR